MVLEWFSFSKGTYLQIMKFFVLLLLFASVQARSQNFDTLVDVGGYHLNFHIVSGKGIPILFESGGGDDGTVWNGLLPAVSDITGATLITYDRAGFGKSEIDTNRHGILNGVKALETGLKKLGYGGSIVLVAHSMGGFYATLYAYRNPEKVKAAILIDANHMCFYNEQRIKATQVMIDKQPKSINLGSYYLSMDFQNTIDVMHSAPFPDRIPATDLISEKTPFNDSADIADWIHCQQAFGRSAPNRKSVMAYGTGHYVFLDNQALAIDAIAMQYAQFLSKTQQDELYRRGFEYSFSAANEERKRDFAYYHSERYLNEWGYFLLGRGEMEKALEVFKLNTALHPESANVWDSEAEAYEKLGDKENAIKFYQKVLEIDPHSTNAKEHLQNLMRK